MRSLSASLLFATAAFAAEPANVADKFDEPNTWSNRANFYVGARGGVAIPAGALGVAPNAGIELGVANSFGFGVGLHAMWMNRPPGAPFLNIPPCDYGFGAMADVRFYFETLEPLTLYPGLSLGFVAGPSSLDGKNAVLPLINPSFGARVKFANFYAAFEFGLAGFTIPFVSLALGYETDRKKDRRRAWEETRAEVLQRQREDADRRERERERAPVAPARQDVPDEAEST